MGGSKELLCDLKCALKRGVSWRVRLHQTDTIIEVGQQQHLKTVNKRLVLPELLSFVGLVDFVKDLHFNQVQRIVGCDAGLLVIVLFDFKDTEVVEVDCAVNVVSEGAYLLRAGLFVVELDCLLAGVGLVVEARQVRVQLRLEFGAYIHGKQYRQLEKQLSLL